MVMENHKFYPNLHSKYSHGRVVSKIVQKWISLEKLCESWWWKWSWKIAELVMESHGKVMKFHFQGFVGTLLTADAMVTGIFRFILLWNVTSWQRNHDEEMLHHDSEMLHRDRSISYLLFEAKNEKLKLVDEQLRIHIGYFASRLSRKTPFWWNLL